MYEISNTGIVRRKEYVIRISPKGVEQDYTYKQMEIKPHLNSGGYLRVNLWRNQKVERFLIHRLVAIHFIENPESKPVVNHKDGDKHNNHADNLEWMTRSENTQHLFDVLGFKPNTSGINPPRAVEQIDIKTGEVIASYNTIREAHEKTKIYHISSVCSGKRNTAGGYKWRYKNN